MRDAPKSARIGATDHEMRRSPVSTGPQLTLTTVNLSAPDPGVLARFYAALLGWEITDEEPDWVMVRPPNGGVALSFERDVNYATPVWPSTASQQRMMMHLEVRVENLASSSAHAQACGATLATYQPQDDVRVHLDPAGHPFCLWLAQQG